MGRRRVGVKKEVIGDSGCRSLFCLRLPSSVLSSSCTICLALDLELRVGLAGEIRVRGWAGNV